MSRTDLNEEPGSDRYYYSTFQMVLMGIGLGITSVAIVALMLHLINLVL